MKKRQKVILTVVAGFVLLVIVSAASSHKATPKTTTPTATVAAASAAPAAVPAATAPKAKPKPQADPTAVNYVKQMSTDASIVATEVSIVSLDITTANANNPNWVAIANDAQTAHDQIDSVRNEFAAPGDTDDDAVEVFTAANDLKNTMGSFVTYACDPNPATEARAVSQFQTAVRRVESGHPLDLAGGAQEARADHLGGNRGKKGQQVMASARAYASRRP